MSTLAFESNVLATESAYAHPTYYRALGIPPRHEHPFALYDGIRSQPELVARTLQSVDLEVGRVARLIKHHDVQRIVCAGVGSSYNLALSAAFAFGRLAGIAAVAVDSAEAIGQEHGFRYGHTLVIGMSASGNTAETVRHLHAARRSGALTIAVTNVDGTRLTESAHDSIVAAGGYGIGWDYSTRLAALLRLAVEVGRELGYPASGLDAVATSLATIPALMEQAIDCTADVCKSAAQVLVNQRACIVVGSGSQLPLAHEMALRLEEVAHFPSHGRGATDFLHSAVGYVAPNIATVILGMEEQSRRATVRVARVTQAVKSPCIALVDAGDVHVAPWADVVIRLPTAPYELRPLLLLTSGQLISYFLEVIQGGNPDIQRTDRLPYARAFKIAFPPGSH